METEERKGEKIAGLSVACGMFTGFASLVVALPAILAANWIGAGVCLAAAGLSFGLVANAALRR